MDYKKIIKNRSTRKKILSLLSFVPDRMMLAIQYHIKTGHRLNLSNPRRLSEKMQWYKLFYKDKKMIPCVDKYDVREYIRSKGLGDILIGDYGVYNSVQDIPWEKLPDKFVLKDTLGGGGDEVIIVKDKDKTDKQKVYDVLNEWLSKDAHKKGAGREWPYYSGKNHRILVEAFLDSDKESGGLIDYKFLCFNGKPKIVYVIADRILGHGAGFGTFDLNYNRLNVNRLDERPLKRDVSKPQNFEKMIEIACTLSNDFPEARIDLYNIKGEIKFGEITFFDGSGYTVFDPDEFDYELGSAFALPAKKTKLE